MCPVFRGWPRAVWRKQWTRGNGGLCLSRQDGTPAVPPPHEHWDGCGVLISFQRPPHSFTLAPLPLPIAAEILQANDNLTQVINLYKQLVRGEEVNGEAAAGSIPGEEVAGQLGRGTPG